jgi:hypothetical protein
MSDKTIAQKLLIKSNYKVLLIDPPVNYESMLGVLPPRATLSNKPSGSVDLIQIFLSSKKDLQDQLEGLKHLLKPNGLLWITYPKGTSKIKVDISRDNINEYAHSMGLQGVAMISIDDTWSALRLKAI